MFSCRLTNRCERGVLGGIFDACACTQDVFLFGYRLFNSCRKFVECGFLGFAFLLGMLAL